MRHSFRLTRSEAWVGARDEVEKTVWNAMLLRVAVSTKTVPPRGIGDFPISCSDFDAPTVRVVCCTTWLYNPAKQLLEIPQTCVLRMSVFCMCSSCVWATCPRRRRVPFSRLSVTDDMR